MASTPLSSLKATISTVSPTTSSAKSSEHSSNSVTQTQQDAHQRGPSLDEDNDSGDDWGVEIGNLIIDLDADVEKDEMKEKNGVRNSNNNNSIEGSRNNTVNQTNSNSSLSSNESIVNSGAQLESNSKGVEFGSSSTGSGRSPSQQSAGKIKSKSKKSIKSATMNKHTSALAQNMASSPSPTTGRNDLPLGNDKPIPSASGARAAKPEVASSKSNRSYKKHGKNNNNVNDRKNNPASAKERREKSNKGGSKSSKHQNQGSMSSTSLAYSVGNANFTAPSVVTSSPADTNKGKLGSSPCFSSTVSNVTKHRFATPIDTATGMSMAVTNANDGALYDKTLTSHANEAPILAAVVRLDKHRKTSSLPAPMKYQKPFGVHNITSASQAMNNVSSTPADSGICNTESSAGQNIVGKRERISSNAAVQSAGSKKIRLEKEGKLYASGMTPNDVNNVEKLNARSPAILSLRGHLENVNSEDKMTVGQEKPSSAAKEEAASSMLSNMQHASKGTAVGTEPAGQGSTNFPQNNKNESTKRTTGTGTSYADVGVSTEPECLGPCEPGTSVHLSGIVWHETESGVLVVNVTWRNRSYVGTLLDATKHDWAPPRIPDVDSDTEYRVKSGRPKRQRGANGSGSDGGRKGRKSAMINNLDEYKCSPSSNKRRSAKMSESEVCSGNDGEICATTSKSAKRTRISRTAAAKSAARKTVVKESSGDGTSGSGSSSCSSPVFMECPYANCKKRYKDDSALKYHESHAHHGEELAEVQKSGQEEESPAADSPKDFDDGSTKSVEEMSLSDSSGSPTVAENDQTPKESNNNNYQTPMETNSQTPSAPAPFVVTQPQAASAEQYTTGTTYTTTNPMSMQSNITKSVRNNDEVRTTTDRPSKTSTEIVNSAPTTRPEETAPVVETVSPYTLTDSQSNDSISLKTRVVQTKQSPQSYHSSRTTTSRPLITESIEDAAAAAAALEESSAVDNESAQAVQTLLQLQENSQDQLPGLTPYGQTSQGSARSMTSKLDTTTPALSIVPPQPHSSYLSPTDKLVTGAHSKPQTAPHTLTAPFRSHSKDGTPLPRMSVGVCSPRSQVGSQYVVGGYSHGTVTSNSSQEKAAHTSTGLKTVKGITVPIPTGTREVLAPSSQSNGIHPITGPTGNAKKQKRKKPKADTGKSPNEPSPKPAVVNQSTARPPPKVEGPKAGYTIPDHTRMKQEHQHQIQSAEKHPGSHHRMQYKSQVHGAKHHVKVEPGMKLSTVPQLPRGQGLVHRNLPHPHRQKIYSQQEQASRGQGTPQTAPGNRNNNNKLNSRGASIQPQQRQANSPIFPDGQDKGALEISHDGRPRLVYPSQASHGISHSLPGSRSSTPVDSSGQPRYRLHAPHARDSTTPTNPASAQGPSSIDEFSTPPPPADSRRLSSEGNDPSSAQRHSFLSHAVAPFYGAGLYNPYIVPYDLAYHPRLMNDPKFQQHFERVIQNEIQKDQKLKEEPSEGPLSRSSSIPRLTPSPNQQKHPRSKTPSRTENRIAREPSPRVQPHTSQHQQLPPSGRQTFVHAPRESPVPHSRCPPSANKLSTGAPAPGSRGLSPRPQATPPPMSSSRPSRPSSETERYSRREPSTDEKPQIASRTPATSNRKPESYPEHRSRSPDKSKLGPPPTTVYASPGLPVQITPGTRAPVQYYTAPYQHALIDPRVSPYAFPAYAMFPTPPHIFPGHWPPSAPPPTVPGPQEKAPSQSPHSMKSSPYRDESERRQRVEEVRGRDSDSYSKERRTSDGPTQQNVKSVTPDPKAVSSRNQSGDGNNNGTVTPPMQRHLHTHHHIHEGFPPLIPAHPQYPYPMASAVMAGSEAAAAAKLAPYPKRDIP